MSKIITPRGITMEAVPRNSAAFTVTELQDIVDGYIDVLEVKDGVIVFDEDGAVKEKLYNDKASRLVREYDPKWNGFISGTALVCPKRMIKAD